MIQPRSSGVGFTVVCKGVRRHKSLSDNLKLLLQQKSFNNLPKELESLALKSPRITILELFNNLYIVSNAPRYERFLSIFHSGYK